MRFRYQSLDPAGRKRSGLLEADSSGDALRRLAGRGETAIRLAAEAGARQRGIGRGELALFLGDLAALYEAGVPVRKALDLLAGQASSPRAAQMAQLMAERLDAGSELGGAAELEESGDIALAAQLIRSGEASGALGPALRFAADLLRGQAEAAQRILKALAYPAFLLALSVGALVVLAAFAGPAMAPLIEEAADPPASLLAFLAIGQALQRYGLLLLVLVAAASLGFAWVRRRPPMDTLLASLWPRVPGVALILRDINCGAFARMLGTMLAGGAPAANAFDLSARSAPSLHWRARFAEAAGTLRDGRTVVEALQGVPALPPELVRLGRIGEESGALGEMLARGGGLVADRALRRLDRAGAMLGPALVLLIGALVGWLMSAFLGGLSQLGEGAI